MACVGRLLLWLSRSDRLGFVMLRVAIAVVFVWVGGLNFTEGAADSLTPFVANNPVLSHLYNHPEQYHAHLAREGESPTTQRGWHRENGTYVVAKCVGAACVVIGLLVLAGLVSSALGGLGAALAFGTSLVTLTFLATTPEAWVPSLGDPQSGFPYLSAAAGCC
jgi:uncharacterized membrane protein YkgB